MSSSRNDVRRAFEVHPILAYWEMSSSRNVKASKNRLFCILAYWEMSSSRNGKTNSKYKRAHSSLLGNEL